MASLTYWMALTSPLAGGQLLDAAAESHFVDVVEAVTLGGDNHRLAVFQEIVVVGDVQPFVVFVRVDDVLLLGRGVVADEVELVLVAVEFEHDSVIVGQPIYAREIAVGVVAKIDFGKLRSGNVIDVNVNQGVVFACFRIFVFEVGRVEFVVEGEVVLFHTAFVEAQEGDFLAVGRPGGGA